MEKTTKISKRSVGVRTLIVVGDILLGGLLSLELRALIFQHRSVQESLAGNILSGNEAEFIAKLESQLPSTYMWVLAVGGLIITIALIIGVFWAKDNLNKIITRINAVWLLAWLVLGIYWISIFIYLLMRVREMFG